MIVLLGNMLFPHHRDLPCDAQAFFMAEDFGFCTAFPYHKHKLMLYLGAMRHQRQVLEAQGRRVIYWELNPENQHLTYEDKLLQALTETQDRDIHTYEIEDRVFSQRLNHFCQDQAIRLITYPTPMFLTSRDEFPGLGQGRKRLFMANFYQKQRQRLGILLDQGGQPEGGQWSFDQENRRRLPGGVIVPDVTFPAWTETVKTVAQLVDQLFPLHPGRTEDFWLPVTHDAAQAWLREFLITRLSQFGPYEDALPSRTPFVFHSLLSPLLNIGLLTPQQVLTTTLEFSVEHPIPLNSLEGFIRQIIGWREYVRGAYWALGSQQETSNFFNHQRRLSGAWQTGKTGLVPVDRVIERLTLRGYAHHIERLMVISNAMLLCEIAPDGVFAWFMAWFVDSAAWVMGPNVYGMGQFADGGRMMTKPYISGSNYLRKMGDYPSGAWQEVWDGLYWRFIETQRDYFAQNPRLLPMLRTFDRLDLTRKQRILGLAAEAILDLTT